MGLLHFSTKGSTEVGTIYTPQILDLAGSVDFYSNGRFDVARSDKCMSLQ